MASGCCLGGGWACACNGLVAGASVVAGVGYWGASLQIRTRTVSTHVRYAESNIRKRHVGIGPLASGDGGVTSGRVRASPRRRFFRSVSIRKYTHGPGSVRVRSTCNSGGHVRGVPGQLPNRYPGSVGVRATSTQGSRAAPVRCTLESYKFRPCNFNGF